MADNGGLEECTALDVDRKVERLSSTRVREQRMTKTKDKFDEHHLPTPPPDPWTTPGCLQGVQNPSDITRPRSLEEEEDIIAYLADLGTPPFESQTSECPSRNSATSTMAVANLSTDEAFEHLDRLYALTEQILELRSRSSRFFKRVRDLERLKVLRNADRRLENAFARDNDLVTDFCEEDTGFAESLLDAMLSNCRDPQFQRRNIRSPSSRQRSRSLALSEQSLPRPSNPVGRFDLEKQVSRNDGATGAPKVSKWTRVKAAFKWERACTNDIVETMDSTVTTPSTPTTKYLRIPEIGTGNWSGSTLSSCTSEVSSPSSPFGRISSASSSNEGSYDGPRKNVGNYLDRQSVKVKEDRKKEVPSRRSRSLDGDMIMSDVVDHAERMTEINHGKPLIRITSENNATVRSSSTVEKKDPETTSKKPTPTLTITIPSNEEEIRCVSSPESISPLPSSAHNSGGNSPQHGKSRQESSASREYKRQRSAMEETVNPAPKMQRQDSKWNKVRRAFLTNAAFSVPPSPVRIFSGQLFLHDGAETPKAHSCNGSVEDIEKSGSSNAQAETRKDYQVLREKLGAEFHQKLIEWERLKNMSPRSSVRNTREDSSVGLNGREGLLPEERLPPEFKKKLQDWKRAKKGRRGSTTSEQHRVSRRRLTDWQIWRSSKPEMRNQDAMGSRGSCGSGGSAASIVSVGKSHLCEDFVRRMENWRRMNEASHRGAETLRRSNANRLGVSSGIDESEFLALEKVLLNFGDKIGRDRRENDARQLDECFDGETKFVDGTQSITCGNEVLIRTSVGSYRFEGISREFTRKLYDWEKYRGISPRSSTFRLLGPAYAPFTGEPDIETSLQTATTTKVADEEKVFFGALKRSKSAGNIERTTENERFIRRCTSLQSLSQLTKRLEDPDRTDTSPAPNDPRRTGDTSDAVMDDSEPEAMIVDIEDVIEETASPLKRVQPHQTPVYSVAASETTSIAVPLGTVTSSHEPSPVFLVEAEENSSRKHWESRIWNQRKNFSSEDSPSPDHFKVTNVWEKRRDSISQDDIDSDESWNNKEYSTRDRFGQYERKKWNRENCSDQDGESVKSNRSVCSIEWHRKDEDEVSDAIQERCYNDFKREEIPVASSNVESANETDNGGRLPDARDDATTRMKDVGNHSAFSKDMKESMDLPIENKHECEYEDQEEEDAGNSADEEDTLQGEMKIDNEYEQIIPATTFPYSRSLTDIQPMTDYRGAIDSLYPSTNCESDKTTFANREDRDTGRSDENYGIIREDLHNRQYHELSKVKTDLRTDEQRKDTDDLSERLIDTRVIASNYEEQDNCIKGTLIFIKPTEKSDTEERRQYRNFENVSTSFTHSINSATTMDYHREPMIRTTPITVTTCREERCFQRIIINEKTLNKIVVPTASTGDTTKNSTQSIEASVSNNSTEDQNQNCHSNHDTQSSNDTAKKNGSPTRNVFVKTKRMIFSPFRRTEDRSIARKESDTTEDEHTLRPKSKSKSRSTSPKILRQDVLLRMPLSLPWSLRPSSKDRDVKPETKIEQRSESKQDKVTFEKQRFKSYTVKEDRNRNSKDTSESSHLCEFNAARQSNVEYHVQTEKDERSTVRFENRFRHSLTRRERQVDIAIQVKPSEQLRRASVSVCSSTSKNKENENTAGSLRSDPLSSDLMHKLKILSSVAARRDGRTNTISVDSSLESHSSRIRRAKESFLSRRGGPLCHSVLESPVFETVNHDLTRRSIDRYKQFPGNREDRSMITERMFEVDNTVEKMKEMSIEQAEGLNDQEGNSIRNEEEINSLRSEASAVSRPDLVKSASAGMINVDPDTFGRLAEPNRGCESLPRTISKRREPSGPLAKIVNKFKLSRLIRGKDTEEGSMSTISRLCRQSLLINVRSDFEEQREAGNHDVRDESPPIDSDDKSWDKK